MGRAAKGRNMEGTDMNEVKVPEGFAETEFRKLRYAKEGV